MATQITTTTTPRSQPAPRFGRAEAAILAVATVMALALIAVGVWTHPASDRGTGRDGQSYDIGYPLHGGFAGPSRVGSDSPAAGSIGSGSTADDARHFGPGYPLHGGLAGPGRDLTTLGDAAGHYGPGYPLRGGLAGPSRVDGAD